MFPEVGDIVVITNSDKEEVIGYYGKITNLFEEDKVVVLYRQVSVFNMNSFTAGTAIVNRRDVSLICKAGDKTKGSYLEELLPRNDNEL